jgi:hypothetical protein
MSSSTEVGFILVVDLVVVSKLDFQSEGGRAVLACVEGITDVVLLEMLEEIT